ncbi:MAG: GtrA family protein [Microbacterium gubbeenense]|uniref:GtrA family protein n=1 Tax=Micrococcales TaxID=85006 RepID=UPI0004292A33|nr:MULTISPECIES: GtrA family protein [Micrococcales]HCG57120.1 GtrA family protein [Brevibacterium sp.]
MTNDEGNSADEAVGGMKGPDGPLLKLFKNRGFAFLVVGGINTGIGFVWFILFSMLFRTIAPGEAWTVFVVIACAQVTSTISAFFLYRRLVFRVTGHAWLDFWRFQLVYLTSFLLNLLVVPPLKLWLGWDEIVAQFAFTFVIAVISWFGHSQFSFRRSAKDTQ